MLHEDRRRAESFGADAERYDRARPTYPAALIDALVADRPGRVLDVGCGTGRVARLFADRGCDVVGVEPDRRMAAVARRHGTIVEDGSFEQWDPRHRAFDLVAAGQAWHWVDPAVGPAKAASVLAPGGRIGLFWNIGVLPTELKAALDDVYRRVAPGLDEYSVLLGNAGPDRYGSGATGLRDAGAFVDVTARRFDHRRDYTTDEWLDQLLTHSDHATLDRAVREELLVAVADVVDRAGGHVAVHYDTWLVTGSVPAAGSTDRSRPAGG